MGMPIETVKFACMAEARAAYLKQGYQTLKWSVKDETGAFRRCVMIKNPEQALAPMVELTKVGFLKVEARELV